HSSCRRLCPCTKKAIKNGKTYDSLSKVAFAITGTNWNGPRFFGLRDKISVETKS
ncbi:MAG: DUF2924 domain-containing protein, partial [Pseudolabrys sp.]